MNDIGKLQTLCQKLAASQLVNGELGAIKWTNMLRQSESLLFKLKNWQKSLDDSVIRLVFTTIENCLDFYDKVSNEDGFLRKYFVEDENGCVHSKYLLNLLIILEYCFQLSLSVVDCKEDLQHILERLLNLLQQIGRKYQNLNVPEVATSLLFTKILEKIEKVKVS